MSLDERPRLADVSHDEFREVVVAFLDQFISRGAKDDLRSLRQRLANDQQLQLRLDRHLAAGDVSEREGFAAMRRFFEEVAAELPPATGEGPDVWELLSWTESMADGQPYDPAQWDDWLGAVRSVVRP